MTNINIGNKIRQLRKKKGITQESLASVLSVSPQAVSKWESGLTYPDVEIIPIIAGYFEVSMDILFGYDVREMKAKIQKIIDDAMKYFFDDTAKYIKIIKDALQDYFSIFAGFLMFDDAIDMAEDARKRLETEASQVKSVHLYKINSIYIPASYILQSLYQAMMSVSNMIDKGISVSIFQEQKKKKDKEEEFKPIEKRWEETGKNILSSTKVNITFLSAFLQLIEQISSTYGV